MSDWRQNELTRLLRTQSEFAQIPQIKSEVPPHLTVFGSARPELGDDVYQWAREFSWRSAYRNDLATMTGGGPGLMEAANRGAAEVDRDLSAGCTLSGLPNEQVENPFLGHVFRFDHFHARKVAMVRYAKAFIIMPGGLGTLDELSEVLTLMQTQKAPRRPLLLVGDFWKGIVYEVFENMRLDGYISGNDLENTHWVSLDQGPRYAADYVAERVD